MEHVRFFLLNAHHNILSVYYSYKVITLSHCYCITSWKNICEVHSVRLTIILFLQIRELLVLVNNSLSLKKYARNVQSNSTHCIHQSTKCIHCLKRQKTLCTKNATIYSLAVQQVVFLIIFTYWLGTS